MHPAHSCPALPIVLRQAGSPPTTSALSICPFTEWPRTFHNVPFPFLSCSYSAFLHASQADATALPFPDASFDSVVDTFSLCVMPDPEGALRELARVVRPGGRVLLLEHAKSDNALLGTYQELTASAVAASAKGCYWNQDVEGMCVQAGLKTLRVSRHVLGTLVSLELARAS